MRDLLRFIIQNITFFQFLQDLYSGKLHREFHYGPDPVTSEEPASQDNNPSQNEIDTNGRIKRSNEFQGKASPPPSQFQHLGPSKNRYTLLHDEF